MGGLLRYRSITDACGAPHDGPDVGPEFDTLAPCDLPHGDRFVSPTARVQTQYPGDEPLGAASTLASKGFQRGQRAGSIAGGEQRTAQANARGYVCGVDLQCQLILAFSGDGVIGQT